MEEQQTIDENQEEIGTVEIPPPTGVFGQPWSMQKLLGLMAVFGPAAIVASVSIGAGETIVVVRTCLLYTSPSPRDGLLSRMPSSA